MDVTEVYFEKGDDDTYFRDHSLKLIGDKVCFDTADGEYQLATFPISLLKEKIKEHEEKSSNR